MKSKWLNEKCPKCQSDLFVHIENNQLLVECMYCDFVDEKTYKSIREFKKLRLYTLAQKTMEK